jgi:hypothetical protein
MGSPTLQTLQDPIVQLPLLSRWRLCAAATQSLSPRCAARCVALTEHCGAGSGGLLAYYPMEEGSGREVFDLHGTYGAGVLLGDREPAARWVQGDAPANSVSYTTSPQCLWRERAASQTLLGFGGEQQSIAIPQATSACARPSQRHFKIQSCCYIGSAFELAAIQTLLGYITQAAPCILSTLLPPRAL